MSTLLIPKQVPLGKVIQEFKFEVVDNRKRRLRGLLMISAAVILILAGLVMAVISAGALTYALGGIGLPVLIAGLVQLKVKESSTENGIMVHQNGLTYKMDATEAKVLWTDVAKVRIEASKHASSAQHPTGGVYYSYILERFDGTRESMVFDGAWECISTIDQVLKKELYRRLIPRVNEKLENGETVNFGTMGVHLDGLVYNDGKVIPWHEVEEVRLSNGWIKVMQRHLESQPATIWARAEADLTDNVFLFVNLIKRKAFVSEHTFMLHNWFRTDHAY